jgi:CubicO group peptidase (beta-lactamase class C family)
MKALDLLKHGLADGSHVGAQIYVSQNGQPVIDSGVGESQPGVAMSSDTINHWLSSGKPVAAVAIAQQWERGRLELDDPVAKHIPEFAAGGKQRITIRHLLTHTGGFRAPTLDLTRDADQLLPLVYVEPLESGWIIGRTAGYHPASSWLILGELVRRLDDQHRTYDRYVREMIFEPLGMSDSWIGMPAEHFHDYQSAQRIGWMFNTSRPHEQPLGRAPTATHAGQVSPGGNLRCPAHDLGRFYQMLLGHGSLNDYQILKPQTVEALTARHRVGIFDQTFGAIVDFGLGFILDARHDRPGERPPPYGYGQRASSRAFGHSGSQSSCAFADPEYGLVVAWLCNGQPGEPEHQRRQGAINAAIYEDLGIDM